MSTLFTPLEGCLANALERQAALADATIDLFKSDLVPDPTTPVGDYIANVADYSGYAQLNFPLWNDPILSGSGGYMILSPLVQFATDNPTTVTNICGGAFIRDVGGDLRLTVIFTEPIPMQVPGQGIPITVTVFFPTGV
jgi:hypothetical protein